MAVAPLAPSSETSVAFRALRCRVPDAAQADPAFPRSTRLIGYDRRLETRDSWSFEARSEGLRALLGRVSPVADAATVCGRSPGRSPGRPPRASAEPRQRPAPQVGPGHRPWPPPVATARHVPRSGHREAAPRPARLLAAGSHALNITAAWRQLSGRRVIGTAVNSV